MSAAQKVTENVKLAREQALVGCYDDAKTYYGVAIHGIQQMMKEKQEPDTNEKWKQVINTVVNLRCNNLLFVVAGSEHAQ